MEFTVARPGLCRTGLPMHDDFRPRHDEERQWRVLDEGAALPGLPMTPAMRACLRAEAAAMEKLGLLALPVLAGILGVWFFWREPLVLIGILAALAGAGYEIWRSRLVRQDLAAGTFSRHSGAWRTIGTRYGCDIELPDGSRFSISDRPITFFPPPPAGEVDYAPHSRISFEIRDADGNVLRRNSHYRP